MRDDFSKITKETLAKRVSYKCSNPDCCNVTVGPHTYDNKSINLGVAAHISAASKGGPRYDASITSEERKSIQNGIWLCQNCAKLVDTNSPKYTTKMLYEWKSSAESKSLSLMVSREKVISESSLVKNRIAVIEKLYYEIREIDSLLRELLEDQEMTQTDKKETAFMLGLLVAKFSDDNSFYLQEEVSLQCIGTFVGFSDIFNVDKGHDKELFEDYSKNLRASYKLLKNVDSRGYIDLSKKTPMMNYFSELRDKHEEEDYL